MEEGMDLFYHALNYRGASTQNAEECWKELQACVDRLIKAEREACAKVCEEDAFVDQWYGLAEADRRIRARMAESEESARIARLRLKRQE